MRALRWVPSARIRSSKFVHRPWRRSLPAPRPAVGVCEASARRRSLPRHSARTRHLRLQQRSRISRRIAATLARPFPPARKRRLADGCRHECFGCFTQELRRRGEVHHALRIALIEPVLPALRCMVDLNAPCVGGNAAPAFSANLDGLICVSFGSGKGGRQKARSTGLPWDKGEATAIVEINLTTYPSAVAAPPATLVGAWCEV